MRSRCSAVACLLLLVLLSACSRKDQGGNKILSVEVMETMIWQMIQADEYTNKLIERDSIKDKHQQKMKAYLQVCALNHTSLATFKKSYQFYMDHPDRAKPMFDTLAARTSRLRGEIYQPKPIERLKPVASAKP